MDSFFSDVQLHFTIDPFEKLQLFLQKLLQGFITQKEEICALVTDFLAGLPADIKRFLDFEGVMGTYAPKMGCEV